MNYRLSKSREEFITIMENLNLQLSTFNPQPSTLNPKPKYLKLETLNPQA